MLQTGFSSETPLAGAPNPNAIAEINSDAALQRDQIAPDACTSNVAHSYPNTGTNNPSAGPLWSVV